MTRALENDEFVSTAPGTSAGCYMRKYWQPVFESDRLGSGKAVLIEVMSERFTLYRAESGKVHIASPSCPHRGTPLSLGEIEGETIRCRHHGWRFDAAGRCVEQPAEPNPFCAQVSIKSYPAREQMGLIFGYFGPLPAPLLPQWPELESECHVASMAMLPCN
jgi:5,5'-dehydrodivanillate O-demethylase oxygenase subunit